MVRNLAFLTLSMLYSDLSLADSANGSTRLQVVMPRSLKKKEGYRHRNALFGVIPFGGRIEAPVFYTSDKLCDTTVVEPSQLLPSREGDATFESPYILMVDRGECTFVTKVRNAQHSGAAAVLVVDNLCQCDHVDCVAEFQDSRCERREPHMADDGSAGDIGIPSFRLYKEDGDSLREVLKSNKTVRVEMSFGIPSPHNRVEYEYWSRPGDVNSDELMLNFKRFAVALNDAAKFTPRYSLYDGVEAGCDGRHGSNECATLCTNHGRYCANDPDNELYKGVSGADVVEESLRRICIWNHYGSTDGVGVKFWSYVYEFHFHCGTPTHFTNDDCISDAYARAGIDGDRISTCMQDSGGLERDVVNNMLEDEISRQKDLGVVFVPTSFVNGAQVKGAMTSLSVFDAICAGYSDGNRPEICDQCAMCVDAIACVDSNGVCSEYAVAVGGGWTPTNLNQDHVSFITFTCTVLMFMGIFVGAGFVHYSRTRREMREQVRGILAEYVALEDNERGLNGGLITTVASSANDASMDSVMRHDSMTASLMAS